MMAAIKHKQKKAEVKLYLQLALWLLKMVLKIFVCRNNYYLSPLRPQASTNFLIFSPYMHASSGVTEPKFL